MRDRRQQACQWRLPQLKIQKMKASVTKPLLENVSCALNFNSLEKNCVTFTTVEDTISKGKRTITNKGNYRDHLCFLINENRNREFNGKGNPFDRIQAFKHTNCQMERRLIWQGNARYMKNKLWLKNSTCRAWDNSGSGTTLKTTLLHLPLWKAWLEPENKYM